MYKRIFAILVLAVLSASYAQAQFRIGVRGGLNFTGISITNKSGDGIGGDMIPGFQAGVVGELPLKDEKLDVAFQPGILFATYGSKFFGETTSINYLQVPLNALFKFNMGESGMKFLAYGGFYGGYALNGKVKTETKGVSSSKDITFGSGDDDYKRLDLGAGFGAGLQYSNFQFGLGLTASLASIGNVEGATTRNIGGSLTLTYLFGR